jgi:D-glycero-D-manno-heptose 1,7-bisphosphate phosphatase
MKLILIDRDGCLNKHDSGSRYIRNADVIEYYPDAIAFLEKILEKKLKVAVVTNQQGVGKGMIPENEIIRMHKKLEMLLKVSPNSIGLFYCPHIAGECECRKPSPKMLIQAMQAHNVDESETIMIGDSESDYLAARNANVAFIHLARNLEDLNLGSKNHLVARNFVEIFTHIENKIESPC